MIDKVVVLEKFYIQSTQNPAAYSEVWAQSENDAVQSVGGLGESECILDEVAWRSYQLHYNEDVFDPDLLDASWFQMPWPGARVIETPERSIRPDNWTDAFGLPAPRLKSFS